MENTYNPSHPWYYYLGGKPLYPKEIREKVRQSDYRGYRDDIDRIDKKDELHRSSQLRMIRGEITEQLRGDIACYRELVCQLHLDRKAYHNNELDKVLCRHPYKSELEAQSHLQ